MAEVYLITPKSKSPVFSGILMKAPPLNRRGRKKWHERYFILRSNKTLECHKSKRAADLLKSPRRIIDLRECISLEIGLEYKNLKHILSLGTFKRTFFLAAPSDPLMLQWAHVVEMVKNARDGESIELLDIGLRHSKDPNAVHRVKPSMPVHRFSITSPNKAFYMNGSSKSTMALSHFVRDSAETINLRESKDSSVELPPMPPRRTSSLSFGSRDELPLVGSDSPTPDVATPKRHKVETSIPLAINPMSNPERGKAVATRERALSLGSPQVMTTLSPVFPEYLPNKVPPPMLATRNGGRSEVRPGKDGTDEMDLGETATGKVSFVTKPGTLHRGKAFRSPSPRERRKHSPKQGLKVPESSVVPQPSQAANNSSVFLHSNMKRSFRYRKITLQHERPLFADKQDGEDSSDEESEFGSRHTSAAITEEQIRKVGPNFGVESLSTVVSRRYNPPDSSNPPRVLCKARANSYSKVTVGAVRDPSDSGSRSSGISGPQTTEMSPKLIPEINDGESQAVEGSSSSPPPSPEVFELPAGPQSDSFLYSSVNSLNSLDNILVDPPAMFESDDKRESGDPQLEQRRTDDQNSGSSLATDRNSTESNDTGYTSSASPGYHERHKLSVTDEFEEDSLPELPEIRNASQQASQTEQSQTSTLSNVSSDSVRQYIPLVFYSPRAGKDASVFAVQVCLVENSDELIKDLIALKSLESYNLVECEELQGSNVSAFGDDFTVATALEDLEFGFSVVTSAQKDLFMRKVRQFQFEIKDLFGCSEKPFSCDVEIRHTDQMTVIPIEVQRC